MFWTVFFHLNGLPLEFDGICTSDYMYPCIHKEMQDVFQVVVSNI